MTNPIYPFTVVSFKSYLTCPLQVFSKLACLKFGHLLQSRKEFTGLDHSPVYTWQRLPLDV